VILNNIDETKTPGIRIENESCVEKSFPEFWKAFESLYQ
jgi:5-enolpyruvylshikimate-3-phosphate synthase